jgi:hypothetical protein
MVRAVVVKATQQAALVAQTLQTAVQVPQRRQRLRPTAAVVAVAQKVVAVLMVVQV